ncbi:MAG: Eco57I restriction-modification methylase domain-containing protein [Bacteroidales bacterium]|nr:Eco57I restriction-modification methylase domain-containing protein [Bacteroidales bacterium]
MDYKEVIESRYNRQNWQKLLHDIFGSRVKFWSTPSTVMTSSPFAKQALWLGTITLSDEQTISIYEVELADSVDIERNRRGIRDMLLTSWRNNGNAGAFMFCYRKNESVLRFSYVSESWKFAEDGTYQKETTDTRRFTYLLGEGHRSRTAIQQFQRLRDSELSLKDLTKAFSVEAVSDMFFDGYKKQYENIIFYITGKRMVKVANKWEERLEGKPCAYIMQQFAHFTNPEKSIRDYVKKLMGRIVFLQFLQKKGWLGVGVNEEWGSGDPEFIQNLFKNCKDTDHFVDNVLEPLFNDLNTERANDVSSCGKYKIPYLNGGLFEREATDETEFPLPEKYMQSLLDFFAQYNFTIDENDPDDAEVGVDPEMLGRIFENLLEDNKDKGAFYTPKEIVSYMCRESLIAYLQTGIEDDQTKEAIRQFVTTHQIQEGLPTNTDQLLKDVKICDPAIGSGAFPMGLLKELFLCRTALEGIDQHHAAEIKKHIIQQNVYGVDIERGAVDIARLRFWLSLIVDEETPQALPNFDYKFMQGNSLIESFDGVDLSQMMSNGSQFSRYGKGRSKVGDNQYGIEFASDDTKRNLQMQLKKYFDITDHRKKLEMRRSINDSVKNYIRQMGITPPAEHHLAAIDPSANQEFFLWHTWFKDIFDNGGFDIVIGNPPYVLIQTFKNEELENTYKRIYSVASYKIDLFHLFIEHGYNILKKDRVLTYINPTTYLTNNYTQPLRDLLLQKTCVLGIINISDEVFDASVNTGIEILIKKDPVNSSLLGYYNAEFVDSIFEVNLISSVKQFHYLETEKHIIQPIYSNDANRIAQKIERQTDVLKNHATVNFGMQLRNRKLFENDVVVTCDVKSLTVYHRKCLTGKDIFNYCSIWQHRYCYFNEEARCGGCWTESVHNAKNKIVIRQVGSTPVCGIDTEGLAVLNSAFMIVCKDYDPFGVLGIINSKLMRFYWSQRFEDKRKTFPKIKGSYLELLPVLEPSDTIIKHVQTIVKAKKGNPTIDTTEIESEIDHLVYQLYGLTDKEIAVIEGK